MANGPNASGKNPALFRVILRYPNVDRLKGF